MTNIDRATGLPELSEGQFWSVRKGDDKKYYDSDDEFWPHLALVERRVVPGTSKFFGLFSTPESIVNETVATRRIISVERANSWGGDTDFMYDPSAIYVNNSYEVTPEDIQKTARVLLDALEAEAQYQERVRQREMQIAEMKALKEHLFGDYPPKTLKDN